MIGKLFNAIGGLFVYRSPTPEELKRAYLFTLSNRELRKIAKTPSHYAKRHLVDRILNPPPDVL